MSQQQNINKGNDSKREKHYIRLQTPLEFKGTLNGYITTVVDLAKQVNNLFKDVFGDYEGCTITMNQFGQYNTTLYFKEKGAGNILPLATPTTGRNISIIDRVKASNLRNRNKTYTISQELKDVVEQFIMYTGRRGNINWDHIIHEVNENVYGGINSIYVRIDNLDINKILKVIYGDENKDGDKLVYNVSTIKQLGMGVSGVNQNYIIKIDQLNVDLVDKLATKVGMVPSIGNIPMIRDI